MALPTKRPDGGSGSRPLRIIDNYQTLRGPEKAAMLLLTVGEPNVGKVFSLLKDEEIIDLSMQMSSLGKFSAAIVENLYSEFSDLLSNSGAMMGTSDSTERLLATALDPERAAMIMEDIRGPAGKTMWDKLSNVNEILLANFLKNEYPQTVAVVISRLTPVHAAKVLENLPENFASEVIMRMLRMEPVKKEILEAIERTLRTEFMTNLARAARQDAHEMMAEIFNNLERNTETRFMSVLEERNQESADRIKSLMFTFEDLSRMDPNSMQILIRNLETSLIALALRGANDTIKELFFSNMSQRAARIMREDMDTMGPVRLREVDDAQAKIVSITKSLAAKGDIVISDGSAEDEILY